MEFTETLSVGEACGRIDPDLSPRQLTDFLYRWRLGRDLEIRAGRKLIPVTLIDTIRAEMRRAGRLPIREASHV